MALLGQAAAEQGQNPKNSRLFPVLREFGRSRLYLGCTPSYVTYLTLEACIADTKNRGYVEHSASLRGAQRRSNLGRFWLVARDCFASLAMTLVTTDRVITKEGTFGPLAPL
jgi:hypothetical protein